MPERDVISGVRNKKFSSITMALLLAFSQLIVLIPTAGADIGPDQTLIEEFSGDQSSIVLRFDGSTANSSAAFEIPQNTTVDELTFSLQYETVDPSPGHITLDFDSDGTPEWGYAGIGYGQLGNQTVFSDESNSSTMTLPVGVSAGPSTLLPFDASIESTSIELDYTPQNSGKWIVNGDLITVSATDLNNDGLDEALVVSSNWNGRGDFGVGWVSANVSNNSFSDIDWVGTCSNLGDIETGDFNGDGFDDVLLWSSSTGTFCYHFWNINDQRLEPSISVDLGQDFVGLAAADIDVDGTTEIVWADSDSYKLTKWEPNSSEFEEISSWQYTTDSGSGQVPAEVRGIGIGNVLGAPNPDATLVLISEFGTVDTLGFDTSIDDFYALGVSYSNMQEKSLWIADLNGDTWADIVTWDDGTNGSLLISDDTQQIYGTVQQTGMSSPVGATATDYNQDGIIDILIPEPSPSDLDNDNNTLNGSLQIYNLVSGQLTTTGETLQPRTMPVSVSTADMTGDGRDELIAICGESVTGLFIDSWHEVHFDFDGDGTAEVTIDGFAQNQFGPNGTQSMWYKDQTSELGTALDAYLPSASSYYDSNGMQMVQLDSTFEMETAGTVVLTNMELSYNFIHEIDRLASGGNLSELVNTEYMEFGDQNFNVSLPFTATFPGHVTLDQLRLVVSPGHPRLPNLDPLDITLNNMGDDWAEIGWSMVTDPYFSEYSLYHSTTTNASYPDDFTLLMSYTDHTKVSEVVSPLLEGGHYEYVIQASFDAEGTPLVTAISDTLQVDMPSVPSVENVTAVDSPGDAGGEITISWAELDRFDGMYDIFVRGESFNDTTMLTPSTIATNPNATSITATKKSGLLDGDGNEVEHKEDIVNEEELWVAVVAYNDSGSNPYVTPYGPVYALDNNIRETMLTMELSSPSIFGEDVTDQDWIVGGAATQVSMSLTTKDDSIGVDGEMIHLTMLIHPQDEGAAAHIVEFNTTTDVDGDAVIEFMWRDIANDTILTDGGDVILEAEYMGRDQSLEKGPLQSAEEDVEARVVVLATFRLLTTNVMVDESGWAELTVELIAEEPWQQPAFTGVDIEFKVYRPDGGLAGFDTFTMDSSGVMTESVQGDLMGGSVIIELESDHNADMPFRVVVPSSAPNPAAWRITDNLELTATLFEYNDSGQQNLDLDSDGVLNDDDNCPGTQAGDLPVDANGCGPSQLAGQTDIVDPTFECPNWSISNVKFSQNDPLVCTIDNSANDVTISVVTSTVTVGAIIIGVSCDNFVQGGSTIPCTLTASVTEDINKTNDEPESNTFEISIQYDWIVTSSQSKTVTYQVSYDLIGNKTGGGGDDTGTDGTDTNNDDTEGPPIIEQEIETSSGILDDPLMLGGIAAAVIAVLLIIVIIARVASRDDDDWDDDWEDEEEEDEVENPLDRILGRTPVDGGGYGEEPRKDTDDRFERDTTRGRMGGAQETQQEQQHDDSYSVDEDGTEWWEDDQGQWWYRSPQMDDWEVWED